MVIIEHASSVALGYCTMKQTLTHEEYIAYSCDTQAQAIALYERNKAIARVNNLPVDRFI